ncbi:unnamed protein product, partial [Scytosiphon promiscuus]
DAAASSYSIHVTDSASRTPCPGLRVLQSKPLNRGYSATVPKHQIGVIQPPSKKRGSVHPGANTPPNRCAAAIKSSFVQGHHRGYSATARRVRVISWVYFVFLFRRFSGICPRHQQGRPEHRKELFNKQRVNRGRRYNQSIFESALGFSLHIWPMRMKTSCIKLTALVILLPVVDAQDFSSSHTRCKV